MKFVAISSSTSQIKSGKASSQDIEAYNAVQRLTGYRHPTRFRATRSLPPAGAEHRGF
jgi:hypothetical protein